MGLTVNRDMAENIIKMLSDKCELHIKEHGFRKHEIHTNTHVASQEVIVRRTPNQTYIIFEKYDYSYSNNSEVIRVTRDGKKPYLDILVRKGSNEVEGRYELSQYVFPRDRVMKSFNKLSKHLYKLHDEEIESGKLEKMTKLSKLFEEKMTSMYPEIIDNILLEANND